MAFLFLLTVSSKDQKPKFWWSPVYQLYFLMEYASDVVSKQCLPFPRSQGVSPMFSSRSYTVLGFILWPTSVNFCIGCKVYIEVHFLAFGYLFVPVLFVEKTVLSLLNCLWTLVENPLFIYIWLFLDFIRFLDLFIRLFAPTTLPWLLKI